MGIFGGAPKPKAPAPAPVTPRLSDTELKARDEAAKLRKRQGVEDNILSLGRIGAGAGDRQVRTTALLGRTAA
jgi:hypothetical protein